MIMFRFDTLKFFCIHHSAVVQRLWKTIFLSRDSSLYRRPYKNSGLHAEMTPLLT